VTVRYSSSLPEAFFSIDRALEFYATGAPERQLGGLINVGYNCYLNAVIQCLAYTPGFGNYVSSLPNVVYQFNSDGPFFLDSFARIFSEIRTRKSACPNWFLQDVPVLLDRFRGPFQQDAHEFFLALLTRFGNECLNAIQSEFVQPPTILTHYFTWHLQSEVSCTACGAEFATDSEFINWSLPVPGTLSFAAAIQGFASEFQVPIEAPCKHCGAAGSCVKSTQPVRYPLVMTVMFMRFDNELRKISDFVEFPEVMTVRDRRYQLYGMIVHEGRLMNRGHFFAYVKDEFDVWYKADDVCVFRVKLPTVMQSTPYVLFYKMLL
jgi:ubiquitin carboxyl-terminal hydrolase 36/42